MMNTNVASTGYDPRALMPVLRAFTVTEKFKSAVMDMLILLGTTLSNILMGIGCMALIFAVLIKWNTNGFGTKCNGSDMDLNAHSAAKLERNGPDTEDEAPAKSE